MSAAAKHPSAKKAGKANPKARPAARSARAGKRAVRPARAGKPARKPPLQLPAGTLHRSIQLLQTALEELNARMPTADVEHIAILINEAMTAEARSFHTPEHVFNLVDPGNPYMTLAALFHDLVYYQVDLGMVPQISKALGSSIEAWDGGLRVKPGIQENDRQLLICMEVFDVKAGQKLAPFGGMNEFLSALVMGRKLGGVVKEADLLLATACIEMTIPFRPRDASGRSPAERLSALLQSANANLHLGLSLERLEQAVGWAARFANRDVANFGEHDVTKFLDNTWKLLPETNPSLRTMGVYSIKSYRVALQKMEGFLCALDPVTIFAQYKGSPPDKEYHDMQRHGARNISTACEYLGIKLLTAAILEALGEISGGDAPVSLFMGDIGATRRGSRLEDYLPEEKPATGLRVDKTLHDLLAFGRASASSFDL
ncbi:MAG TPA: hypothetical protein VMM82_01210, partial [Spirochaetia bacterium]|nr:hypothetical protein [Spirochaetia bacterium]